MSNKIAHRGPDGQGYFLKDNIGLAHNRLAILDISKKGAQPMSSKNNKWTIVFNGCIYNFSELKQELKSKGHIFISDSDTEVICEGIQMSMEFLLLKNLNGMFAIAAWDIVMMNELYA
jgi:asparagine synthase (glutamine-hydrolysing)